jgi:hypothetical protein
MAVTECKLNFTFNRYNNKEQATGICSSKPSQEKQGIHITQLGDTKVKQPLLHWGEISLMRASEMILTGLALTLLACWEVGIGEIPLGLLSIDHAGKTSLFSAIIVFKLLLAALLFSRSLSRLEDEGRWRLPLLGNLPCRKGMAPGTEN